MKCGIVTTNILDLWSRPKFNSERLSQLLFGDMVKITSESSGYYRVIESDEYTGWVDKRFVTIIKSTDYKKLANSANIFISSHNTNLYDSRIKKKVDPFHLYYGTKLKAVKSADGYHRITLPNRSYLIKSSAVDTILKRRKTTSAEIIQEAKRFLGVPYLWGGITAIGFDCSGFVRTVFSKYGIYLPRDTKEQIKHGQLIDRDSVKSGDLLFFKRHVGIAIGKDRLIHASVGGGGVRINSLKETDADYRSDLAKEFKEARRIIC